MAPSATSGPADAAKYKEEGNDHFKYQRWKQAVAAYTKAIECDPNFHVAYSNRSAAYNKMGKGQESLALADAQKCIDLAPDWPKGYSRKAQVLISMKQFEEALEVCDRGLHVADDESKEHLQKMKKTSMSGAFFKKIAGKWHGPVTDTLGGFVQEFDFTSEKTMIVSFMDKAFQANVATDVTQDPMHLDLQIVHPDAPAGFQAPPVPYIMKLVGDDKLLICCPYMSQTRCTKFEGPGLCELKRGAMHTQADPSIMALSKEERFLLCAKATLEKIPDERVETPSQTDSEEVASKKLMSNIRFQNTVHEIEKTYGADALREVFTAAHHPEHQPQGEYGDLIRQLHVKMAKAALLSDEVANKSASVPQPEPQPANHATTDVPTKGPSVKDTPASHCDEDTDADDTVTTLIVGSVLIATAAVIGYAVWRNRRR